MRPEALIQRYLLGESTDGEISTLEALLEEGAEVLRKFVFEAGTDAGLREIALERAAESTAPVRRMLKYIPMAAAAGLAFLLGLAIMHFGGKSASSDV